MIELKWAFLPQWGAWWLVYGSGATVTRGYGPFMNDFEIQAAAAVHGVPFEGPTP